MSSPAELPTVDRAAYLPDEPAYFAHSSPAGHLVPGHFLLEDLLIGRTLVP
jgi:hypothetical protein